MKNIAIKEHHLYNKAFQKGRRYVGKYVAIYVLKDLAAARLCRANPQKTFVNRLGISVSKKMGCAPKRNRAKRVCRAAYDTLKAELATGNLIVIAPRKAILDTKSGEVADEMRIAFSTLGLLSASEKGK